MNKLINIIYLFLFLSCNNSEIKEKELSLKEKELELQERKIKLEESIKQEKSNSDGNLNLSELFKLNSKSVFLILTKNSSGISQGSGFFIREDGLGVSNYHVFKDAEEAIIRTSDGEQYMITEITNYNEEKDFIVFKISNTNSNSFRAITFAKLKPEIGEECFAIGNPQGLEQTLSKGIISGYRGDYIQTTAQITHGSSGGALFNKQGEVIGITTKGLNEADLNFALNIVDFDFLSNYETKIEPANKKTPDDENLNRDIVVNILEGYFDALSRNDFTMLEQIFAAKLTRFYNEFNFTKQQAINDHRNYAKKYPNPISRIDYNSIKMNMDLDGSILVNFNLDFTIKKDTWKSSKTFTYDMFVKIDSDKKINSVFTNIINVK